MLAAFGPSALKSVLPKWQIMTWGKSAGLARPTARVEQRLGCWKANKPAQLGY